jgi:hypothetical protein
MTKLQMASLLALIGVSMIPASAEQSLIECNRAVFDYRAITGFDKTAATEGSWICGTSALMAKHQMRVACSKVTTQTIY